MYEAGLLTVVATLILLIKLPTSWIRRLLWLDVPIDIVVTATFVFMFAGTYSGMMAAIVAGLIFSIILGAVKLAIGHERLSFQLFQISPRKTRRKLVWVKIPGRL